MGLFKDLVELGTKWKIIDKHGLGAGLLYEDEVNKRKLDAKNRENSYEFNQLKKGYYDIANDVIKDNEFITAEEKKEIFNILSKIDNTSDKNLVIMYGRELNEIFGNVMFNNFIRGILKQLGDVIEAKNEINNEVKEAFLNYSNQIEIAKDYIGKRLVMVKLLDYLGENKVIVSNKEEILNSLDNIHKKVESRKKN